MCIRIMNVCLEEGRRMAIDREYSCKLPSEEWREEKKRKRAQMAAMQALPYEIAEIWEQTKGWKI